MMRINTKLNIGDIAWVMDEGEKAHSFPVHSIEVNTDKGGTDVRYIEEKSGIYPGEPNRYVSYSERSVFTTKADLINVLMEMD